MKASSSAVHLLLLAVCGGAGLSEVRRRSVLAGLPLVAAPAAQATPLGLKGTYWESGDMVYRKEEVSPEDAFVEFRSLVDGLRGARRSAEVGDVASLRQTLDDVSERRLRLASAPLLASVEDDAAVGFRARLAFKDAIDSYAGLMAALETRDLGKQKSQLLAQVISALSASGLIFLFPMSAVNLALQKTSTTTNNLDAGLAIVAALDDCIKASDTFIALVATKVVQGGGEHNDTGQPPRKAN
eukprot:CAMPEP_0118898166 /NCGR_PEP_ID=MMETSP1166-20130328/5273_1 /TAXON_ID=1104430 /ORGANISM="Chrysoreinhardia sp, Strain CCMP3193" /LENGTH=241 /DNA_ID=CAMNT_0006837261 /DNA_START=11 /DNA_END=736 /DNA_ORIENTATION=+